MTRYNTTNSMVATFKQCLTTEDYEEEKVNIHDQTKAKPFRNRTLGFTDLNSKLRRMKFALGGRLISEANKIRQALTNGHQAFPFTKVLQCDLGNPQFLGQKPITYYRDVLALVNAPHKLESPNVELLFSSASVQRAKHILTELPGGTGSYSDFRGVPAFRRSVADFLEFRDGFPADPEAIYLTNGASEGIQYALTLLANGGNIGVFTPVPQYPLYGAVTSLVDAVEIPYYLQEDKGWTIDLVAVKTNLMNARQLGVEPRVFVLSKFKRCQVFSYPLC